MSGPDSTQPELLAPAGNWDCLRAAVANGADAVYCGLPKFNARLRADNFREDEIEDVVQFAHRHGVKLYVTFNTLIFTNELDAAAAQLRVLSRAGVDALIVQDIGLVRLSQHITPDLPIHASTQMTVTSPEGAEFARRLGVERVVLARELSLRELRKFDGSIPLETFVHGALCVAYSGQCLTSESLGQRSANRGECAQACRMPYELIVDGTPRDLGDKRYLLSPQDLAAVNEIPELLRLGVVSFKIEGRLKSPEYVAAVTHVYRKAIDSALAGMPSAGANVDDRYQLEMTFSRGLYSGWLHGVNHQELVSARFGKKRGPYAGRIEAVGIDHVVLRPEVELKPGDGIVFDTGGDTNGEQGGRIFQIQGNKLFFRHRHIDFHRLKRGDRVWKTDDPALDERLRKSFSGRIAPRKRTPIDLTTTGRAGEFLRVEGLGTQVRSKIPLVEARTAPLTTEKLREHLGRLGESGYVLGDLRNDVTGDVLLPIGELNRMRRELVFALDMAPKALRREIDVAITELLPKRLPGSSDKTPALHVLCRSQQQIEAALNAGVTSLYVDFEDIRRYREAVATVRQFPEAKVALATPRIQKAGEQGFFKLIESFAPDALLVRNLGALAFYRNSLLPKIGDFSLNVANPLTAEQFMAEGLARLTASYDLNLPQVLDLLQNAPPEWFEITIHQHMPMFHMEHCVFAAFLSQGTDHTNCGRPCEAHRVHLRDRVGIEHPLRADVGCRNTLFNAVPQSGARFFTELAQAGMQHFRIELLEQDAMDTRKIVKVYQDLLSGDQVPEALWRHLKARSQLGVTTGTMASL
ncbi:MAG TPA: U32 family peptidase [Chthoniobacterales bacterium]